MSSLYKKTTLSLSFSRSKVKSNAIVIIEYTTCGNKCTSVGYWYIFIIYIISGEKTRVCGYEESQFYFPSADGWWEFFLSFRSHVLTIDY